MQPGAPDGSAVRVAVIELFAARIAGASPRDLAQRFGADVAAEHFARLGEAVELEQFDLVTIRASGQQAVVTGAVRATVRATGRGVAGTFVLDVAVDADGLITRYRLLDDGWAASGVG